MAMTLVVTTMTVTIIAFYNALDCHYNYCTAIHLQQSKRPARKMAT